MSCRTRFCTRFWLIVGAIAFLVTLGVAAITTPNVFTEISGVFELDGNATQETTADDWDTLNTDCPSGGSTCTGANADFDIFTGIVAGTGNTTFTQGSKDTQDTTAWTWIAGSVPDKDFITHSYAAAYTVSGHTIVTFGADRLAQNGDADLGFWFFQNSVGPTPTPNGSNGGTFTGSHKDHELLVLANFTSNKTTGAFFTGDVEVLEWNAALCLPPKPQKPPASCVSGALNVLFN